MPLRPVNNPNTDISIMNALVTILPVGTQLAASSQSGTGQELIFVQNKYKMSLMLSQTSPIAVHLSSGHQSYTRRGQSTFEGSLSITVGYYSRWDELPESIDSIWAAIAADLERMKSNIEDNDSTAYQGTNQTMSVPQLLLDPYESEFDKTFPGLSLVFRRMIIVYNLLPYR